MYSFCILTYVSVYLYSYPAKHSISGRAAEGPWEHFAVHLEMLFGWTQRYPPLPWLNELGEVNEDQAWVDSHTHGEVTIERDCRFTCGAWSTELWDSFRNCDGISLNIYWMAMIERVWRFNYRSKLSQLSDTPRGHDQVLLEIHMNVMKKRTHRLTLSLWSTEHGDALGCHNPCWGDWK